MATDGWPIDIREAVDRRSWEPGPPARAYAAAGCFRAAARFASGHATPRRQIRTPQNSRHDPLDRRSRRRSYDRIVIGKPGMRRRFAGVDGAPESRKLEMGGKEGLTEEKEGIR